jgi:hypothetical protein
MSAYVPTYATHLLPITYTASYLSDLPLNRAYRPYSYYICTRQWAVPVTWIFNGCACSQTMVRTLRFGRFAQTPGTPCTWFHLPTNTLLQGICDGVPTLHISLFNTTFCDSWHPASTTGHAAISTLRMCDILLPCGFHGACGIIGRRTKRQETRGCVPPTCYVHLSELTILDTLYIAGTIPTFSDLFNVAGVYSHVRCLVLIQILRSRLSDP